MLPPNPTRWSEEDLCEVPIDEPVRRTRGLASNLRAELSSRNLTHAHTHPHELTRGASVIYAPAETLTAAATHGNFLDASYRRILAHPQWAARLRKAHTAKRQARPTGPDEETRAWCELDAASSSDALLMNIFCYPRLLSAAKLCALLGVEPGTTPTFGYRPRIPFTHNHTDRTEIDMQLGNLLVEAKLTETDFQFAPARLVERYPGFEEVFDRELLEFTRRGVRGYQLIRGVLAAYGEDRMFCVLLDARRPDLIEDWYGVMRAVRSPTFGARLGVLTWQEIASVLPQILRSFLAEKYGILAHADR